MLLLLLLLGLGLLLLGPSLLLLLLLGLGLLLGLLIAPVELRVVAGLLGLLPLGIGGGCRLIGPSTVSRLLRRWRIPRVIRHVAKSLFLYFDMGGLE